VDNKALKIVEGAVPETAAVLKQKWDYIFFTGSETVGKIVMKAAAEYLTPCTLELGGKSPVIVHEDADLDLAARRIIWGKCFNAGQSCIAPDYVYVHSRVRKQFSQLAAAQINKFYGKEPKLSPDFARIVNQRHAERLAGMISAHRNDIIAGGEVNVSERYISPTLIELKKPDGKVMDDEIFGPILPIIEYTNLNEVLEFVNKRPKPLALYIFSSNSSVTDEIITKTSSGGVSINDVMMHFANHELPFGGVGPSGYGAYHGKNSFEAFSHAKPVLHKSIYGDAPIRYPPYTAFNAKVFRWIAEIYRVNSDSFKTFFKYVLLPMLLAMFASRYVTVSLKSHL